MVNPKNNRGQVLVLVALSLVIILGFAALAIDIGYFHHTKNQLQGAADAAALAGAAKLGDSSDTTQTDAKAEAVKYGGLNTAAGSSVVIDPSTDITVGSWNTPTYTPGATPVNAVKVSAKMTVNRLFGRILPNATDQDIQAQATAMAVPKKATVPMCADGMCYKDNSSIKTPLTGAPLGKQFCLQSSMCTPNIAWTGWLTGHNKNEIMEYWNDFSKLPKKYCSVKNMDNTNGVVNAILKDDIANIVSANSATYVVKGKNIYGYKVLFPVYTGCDNNDPGKPTSSHDVALLTEGIITKVVPQGNTVASFYIVATGDCVPSSDCGPDFSAFTCVQCGTPGAENMEASKSKLVE